MSWRKSPLVWLTGFTSSLFSKADSLGITTISLALDLYWHFTNAGLGGTLVTDTEENRDMFRGTLGAYMEGLPKEYKIPMLAHNRN
jgi:hypothetical protein